MGELTDDLGRCLETAQCDAALAARAACACEEGRLREAKRVLLNQRQQLLDDVHSKQRSIDEIDHVLHRMGRVDAPPVARPAAPPAAQPTAPRGARDGEGADHV